MVDKEFEKQFEKQFLKAIFHLAVKREISRVFYISDSPLAVEELKKPSLKKKIVFAVTSQQQADALRGEGRTVVSIPEYPIPRIERIMLALTSATGQGYVKDGDHILCLIGKEANTPIDTAVHYIIGKRFDVRIDFALLASGSDIAPQVLEAVIMLAHRIGHEGYEGRPVGTIFVIGDSVKMLESSRQMIINPFQGYPEAERNILDPKIADTVKNFAPIDGAFVIRGDGVVLTAGRYIESPQKINIDLPMGLGARHIAGAVASHFTKALSVVVSQTSGSVRIFKNGKLVLEIKQEQRRS